MTYKGYQLQRDDRTITIIDPQSDDLVLAKVRGVSAALQWIDTFLRSAEWEPPSLDQRR